MWVAKATKDIEKGCTQPKVHGREESKERQEKKGKEKEKGRQEKEEKQHMEALYSQERATHVD